MSTIAGSGNILHGTPADTGWSVVSGLWPSQHLIKSVSTEGNLPCSRVQLTTVHLGGQRDRQQAQSACRAVPV